MFPWNLCLRTFLSHTVVDEIVIKSEWIFFDPFTFLLAPVICVSPTECKILG